MFDKVAPGIFCLTILHLSTDGQSTAFQILQPVPIFGHPHYRKKSKKKQRSQPWSLTIFRYNLSFTSNPFTMSLWEKSGPVFSISSHNAVEQFFLLTCSGQTLFFQLQIVRKILQPLTSLVLLHWIHSGVPQCLSFTRVSTTWYSSPDVVLHVMNRGEELCPCNFCPPFF